MRPVSLLAFVFVTGLSTLTTEAAPTLPGVGAAMTAVIASHEVAGAVTLVATKDKVIHLEATGLANLAEQKPMQTDSLFWLASVTKPFTGVAILMLQDEGKLKVTDPVAKYLPAFADLKTPSGRAANLTIQQVLTHTSGLAEIKRPVYSASKNLAAVVDNYFPAAPMLSEPGEKWKYTSFGFDIAGRIVEVVSGQNFDAFLQQRILDPLAMHDTTFYPTDEQYARLAACYVKNRTTGALDLRALQFSRPIRGVFPPMPAGGLYSTASDLARFGQLLLNHGVFEGKRYLSESSYQMMTTIHTDDIATGYSASQINHVLGWGLSVYVLRTPHEGASSTLTAGSFGHPGACGTHLIIDPVKGLVYVLMVQRSNLPDNFENEPTRAFLQAATAALASTAKVH